MTGVAWLAATLQTVRRGGTAGRLIFFALIGSMLALCYYPLFILLVFVLIALVAVQGARHKSTQERQERSM